MQHHRFRDQSGFASISTATDPVPKTGAFMACPAALCSGWREQVWSLVIYQLAYERARDAVRPSILERLQAVSWN
jgi:hypothetical protein